jgi:DNA-binding HxlR family transcriptional regulator/putative sterol carrier protein
VVGERWTLLIVRELLTGPQRFTDLGDSLRGIGTGLLAARLKHLEAEGLVRRVKLSRAVAYELTEAGHELGPAVLALARWGLKWALGDRQDGEEFRPGWAVLGLQALFEPDAAADLELVYEWRIGNSVFHAHIDHGTIESAHGPAQRPDAVIEASEEVFCEMTAGRVGLKRAIAEGRAAVWGDSSALSALRKVFVWPERRVAAAALPDLEATAS